MSPSGETDGPAVDGEGEADERNAEAREGNGDGDAPDAEAGKLASRTVHDGRIVHLAIDRVRFPDGSVGELEMVRHPGASAVLPVDGAVDDPDPHVILVRQYRYAAGGRLYEVPAGLPESPDESWEACARRELEEETGYRAGSLRRLTSIFTTPGFTDERIHLFLATGLEPGPARRDADEFMEVARMPVSRALRMVREGEIVDGKSVATLLYAASFVLKGV